jgi:hypothetical protein
VYSVVLSFSEIDPKVKSEPIQVVFPPGLGWNTVRDKAILNRNHKIPTEQMDKTEWET